MSDFSKPALTALEALVVATWTDCLNIYRTSTGSWFNWRDQIKTGGLTVPFAVMAVTTEEPTPDWGVTNKTYRLGVDFYYVRDVELSSAELLAGNKKVEDLIYPKMAALREAIFSYATTPSGPLFQWIEDPRIDLGLGNPANEMFATNGDTYWAGMLSYALLVGETYR